MAQLTLVLPFVRQGTLAMRSDAAVFDAMSFDPETGEKNWTGRMGTRQAIQRDGFAIDPKSLAYCPQEWLDGHGYIDLELARKHPRHVWT